MRRKPTGGGRGTTRVKGRLIVKGESKQKNKQNEQSAAHAVNASNNAKMGLESLTQEPFVPQVTVTYRFDFGELVERKPDWLDTEIGRVDFTEDLVMGFDDEPPPQSYDEAWDMIVEAADRYARLTAFIAAEQGKTCDRIANMYTRIGDKYPTEHPHVIMEAIERHRDGPIQGDEELDRIVKTLDGSLDEDQKILMTAAKCYAKILKENALLSSRGSLGSSEFNLNDALTMHQNKGSGRNMWNYEPRYDIYIDDFVKNTTVPYADQILSTIPQDVLTEIEKGSTRPEGVPFVEKFPAGIRLNMSEDVSLEISEVLDGTGWEPDKLYKWGKIMRVKNENGERVVLSESDWSESRATERLRIAADFTRPIKPGWEPNQMVGFKNRNEEGRRRLETKAEMWPPLP
jgi:hypothetical protein